MFMQEFHGKVRDPDLWSRQLEKWRKEIKPKAKGFLGSTSGITPDGTMVTVVRFEDEAQARANSNMPEQTKWFEETSKAFEGELTFHDCAECDTYREGGSDRAGFVQVMEGHAKDMSAMRDHEREMEASLGDVRPDILGTTTGWEKDGSFVTIAYFTSEKEARKNEQKMGEDPRFEEFMSDMEDVTFYDLREPVFV